MEKGAAAYYFTAVMMFVEFAPGSTAVNIFMGVSYGCSKISLLRWQITFSITSLNFL